MKLYHGGLEIIEKPEIRQPNRRLDYGKGFYLTSSLEQAEHWVKRKLDENNLAKGYVNIYEYDPTQEVRYKVLHFTSADEKWLDFVMQNRLSDEFEHDYDLVKGPVANDRVYAAFALYEARLYNKQRLIEELRTYKLVDQVLLHTPKSLDIIRFVEYKTIER